MIEAPEGFRRTAFKSRSPMETGIKQFYLRSRGMETKVVGDGKWFYIFIKDDELLERLTNGTVDNPSPSEVVDKETTGHEFRAGEAN